MIPNNNLSVLAWYSDISQQNHRKSYAFGNVYPLFTPDRTILPFQLVRETRAAALTVLLFDKEGNQIANITGPMNTTGLQIMPFTSLGYDVILYPGILPMDITTPEGVYYLIMSDGVQTWYSELFTIVRSVKEYLKITWWDFQNVEFEGGQIIYEGVPFRNVVYLCTEVGKPEYNFEEQGDKRDGVFFPEKQLSSKTYNFTFLAPEYLCDAMRIIRMSDHVLVQQYSQTYECNTFLMTPKWQTQGDIAAVSCEFECATVIKKIGRGRGPLINNDYNNDFNNDFKNND